MGTDSREMCGNFLDPDGIAATVRAAAPDIIVNAAAYTAVDKAESESDIAHLINAHTPGILAREAEKTGAWLVHYSTDYVFDGSGDNPWKETGAPNPLSVYGTSKHDGEKAIQASNCKHLIFRTSWCHAPRGNNFAKTILRLAKERDKLSIVADQIGAPTGADLVADITAHALRTVLQNPKAGGLYHLAAEGEVSWHGDARFVLDFARNSGLKLQTAPENVTPIPSRDFPAPARRPLNSRLDKSKLKQAFSLHLPDWQSGVARTLSELLA
jgi:dTDP-4-dehydrorhamnose reductase